MENIDGKKVGVAIVIILVLIIGLIFGVHYGVVSKKKYELETISYEDYKYFAVYEDEKYGVIDANGSRVIPCIYNDVTIPNPSKAVFICQKEDGKKTVLNADNEEIFLDFEEVSEVEIPSSNLGLTYDLSVLKYKEDGQYGLINFEGEKITKAIYDEISSLKYKEGEFLAKKDGKYGVINNKGNTLIPFEYEEIEGDMYYNGSYEKTGYIVKSKSENGYRYGYINSNWKKLLDTKYTNLYRIVEARR